MFREAALADVNLLFTFVFSPSRNIAESYFAAVEQNRGTVCPVYLSASREVLERRVVGESRIEVGKMHTVDDLRDYFKKVTEVMP